jgi:type IV pilus assembly protein PilB
MTDRPKRLDPITESMLQKMVSRGLLKKEDAKTISEERENSDQFTSDLIRQRSLLSEKQLICFLSEEFDCPSVNPTHFIIDESLLRLIPSMFAYRRRVLPVTKHDNVLTVAMDNPADLELIDDIKAVTNLRIRPTVALSRELSAALQQYYPAGGAKDLPKPEEMIDELIRIVQETKLDDGSGGTVNLLKQAQETPVIKIANLLLLDAIRRKASDLFIEQWERTVRVRCRVDGLLEDVPSPPKALGTALVSRFKVMSQLDIAERRLPQDGRFKVKIQGREIDVRVSIIPTSFGEKVCLRILDRSTQAQGIDKLGFNTHDLTQIKECAIVPHGMILVTGPTGSGKTTTLYSILKFLDSAEKNITTVEDPVEYETDGINQVNVREAIGMTFSNALRSILRQDPDIILIGEIRDLTTMDIAIKAALTGHLVLSTLHTNDTAGAIVRMENMGIEPFLISSSVLMVSAQRLLRKLCPTCRKPVRMTEEIRSKINVRDPKLKTIFKPAGCVKCRSTGYQGRTVITEILRLSPLIKKMVMEKKPSEEIKKVARKEGMTTLRESGFDRVFRGETSLDEVLRLTSNDMPLEGS